MSNYWQDRQKELYSALEKDENDLKIRLASVYEDEYSRLDKEIAAYYQKYGENNVIKYRNLMQTLPREDVKLLIEQMDDFAAKYPQYAHLLPVRTSIYKLDRLEGLQYSVRMHQLNISAVNQQAISEHLNKQALRGANAAMETMGFGKNFYTVNSDIVKKFVDVPWCNGLSFSQRIWQDGDKLANYITTDIAQGFARGTSYQKLTKQLCTRFEGVAKKDAYRLIYTEGTYVMAESTIQPFTEDFEDYRVSTAADGKVCSICSSIAKETFKIKDRKPGINFPPLHPWCRCIFEIVEPADWDKWMDDYVKRHNANKSQAEKCLQNICDSDIIKKEKQAIKVLTDKEEYALNQYISSDAYLLNEKLRRGIPLTEEENILMMNLDSALQKLPKYNGDLSRSLYFNDDETLKEFLSSYQVGNTIEYKEFLSTTCGNTYNPDGQVQIYILDSKSGRNLTMFNQDEQEILYSRNSKFVIVDLDVFNSNAEIYLREVR